MDLKTGDIIQLKSGGPAMTIIQFDTEAGVVTCNWFDGKELNEATFPIDAVGECKLFVEGAY